jgi:rubrerythrin
MSEKTARSRFAELLWEPAETVAKPGLLESLGPKSKGDALRELFQRTRVPRHPLKDGVTAREEAEFLLQAAAEVEHQFVLAYLYAFFSLDPDPTKPLPAKWRPLLRKIAIEEMGHLITVQNILLCIKAQPYLERASTDHAQIEPFPFTLSPFSRNFVERYLVAESPMEGPIPPGVDPALLSNGSVHCTRC